MTNDERDKILLEIRGLLKGLEKDISRHDKTLYGNGQPGICSRVQTLEDYHANETGFAKKIGGTKYLLPCYLAGSAGSARHM